MYSKLHQFSKEKQSLPQQLNETAPSIDRTVDFGNRRQLWTPVANGMIDEVYVKKTSKKCKDAKNYDIPSPNRDFWTRVTTASGHRSPHLATTTGNKGSRGFSPVLHRVKSIETLNNVEKKLNEEEKKQHRYHLVNMFRTKAKKPQSLLNATRVRNISLRHIERESSPELLEQRRTSKDKANIRQLEGSIQEKLIDKHHRLGPSIDSSASTQQYSSFASHTKSRSSPVLRLSQVMAELKAMTQKYMVVGRSRESGKNE
jgi:hypothetical protein